MGFWSKLFGRKDAGPTASTPQELFAEACLAEVRKHPLVVRAEHAPGDEYALLIWKEGDDEPSQKFFLENTFAETRELDPDARAEAVRRNFTIFDPAAQEATWEETQGALVPVLRIASFAWFGKDMVWRGPLPFLRIFVAIDSDTSIHYATLAQLETWHQAELDVLARALANLQAHVDSATADAPDCEIYDPSAPYPIWHVTRNDSYETSRLVLPDYLEGFRGKVNGTPIAVVPHRSLLIIAGDADAAAIARLARTAESEFAASTRSISPAVYTVDPQGSVIPLHLPAEHPEHAAVERGHRLLAQTCYADQKKQLEERFEAEGTDIFVASYGVLTKKETGLMRSWGSMTKDVRTLLPKAELVALNDLVNEPFFVPWDTLFELAAECFEPADEHDPPRILITGWPSPSVLAALKERAFRF